MKYALIGCGRISPHHIEAAKNNQLEIVAVCDTVENKMDKYSYLTHVNRYRDYKEMLEKEKPSLVAIATDSGQHAKIAMDCIKARCHVIIEKPIALSMEDADAIIQLAKEKDVLVCVCHQNRFNKSIQYVYKALKSGRFGRLFHGSAHVYWNRNQDYYKQASWRGTWEQDGGALMNQCIHNIDMLRLLMDSEVKEVFAYTDNLNHSFIETEDLGVALVKFNNGAYGVIEGTTNVYPKNLEETLCLFGEFATVKVGGKSLNEIVEWNLADGINDTLIDDALYVKETFSERPPNIYGYGHTPLYSDMIHAIQNNRQPFVNGDEGKKALEIVLAIYQSSFQHAPVKLPLSNVSTTDFMERFKNE